MLALACQSLLNGPAFNEGDRGIDATGHHRALEDKEPMEPELTQEEELAIRQIECSSKWDTLFTWLSVLLPSLVIAGIGVWNDSMLVVSCAGITFILLILWGLPRQIREQVQLKSAIQKLRKQAAASRQVRPLAGDPGPG